MMYGYFIIFCIGLGFLAYGAYVLRRHSIASHWPTIEGKLIAFEYGINFEVGRYTKFQYKFPKAEYEYWVDGIKYLGNQVNQDMKSTWIAAEKKSSASEFFGEVGETVKVHYNPQKPSKSVLRVALSAKRKTHYLAICVSGILLMAIGIGLAIFMN